MREKEVEIEGMAYAHPMSLLTVAAMIQYILDRKQLSGETLCLEIKDENGQFVEIDRWG